MLRVLQYVVVCERFEGGRILANLEMHEVHVLSDSAGDSVAGLPPVGSVVIAQ